MRLLVPVALIVAVVTVVVTLTSGSDYPHRLTVTVAEANSVVPGQKIRLAGSQVGEVTAIDPVDGGRAAKLELTLSDRAWPLTDSSRMTLRWGGTVNFANRYITLEPGKGGTTLEEGAAVDPKNFAVPLEFDGLLRSFPATTRADVRDFIGQAGASLERGRDAFGRTLEAAPPALEEASFVVRDLDAEHAALAALVRSGDRVLAAVQASEPDLKALLDGAGGTFDAMADEASSLQQALDGAPSTFANARDTLARADGTLVAARTLSTRIAPGVTELRRSARPLAAVLDTVRVVGPDAEATLASVRRAAPDLNPLLRRVTALSPQIESIGEQSVDNLKCIRPFTPDVMSYFSNWGDFHSATDGKDKLIRAQVQGFGPLYSNVQTGNSAQLVEMFPDVRYGFPRPPGYNAGQPWFLPECGAGKEALDPKLDPEARFSGMTPPSLKAIVPIPKGTK